MGHLRLFGTRFLSSKDVLRREQQCQRVPAPSRESWGAVSHDWPLRRSAGSGLDLLHGTWTRCAEEPWGETWFVFSTQHEGKFLYLTKADTTSPCSTPKASLLAWPDLQSASSSRPAPPHTAPAPSLHKALRWGAQSLFSTSVLAQESPRQADF